MLFVCFASGWLGGTDDIFLVSYVGHQTHGISIAMMEMFEPRSINQPYSLFLATHGFGQLGW